MNEQSSALTHREPNKNYKIMQSFAYVKKKQ